jgi:AbrB family looped-hinge helix DNA binding protein
MQATLKLGRAGQVVIPAAVREALGLTSGDIIIVDVLGKVQKLAEQEANQGNREGIPGSA